MTTPNFNTKPSPKEYHCYVRLIAFNFFASVATLPIAITILAGEPLYPIICGSITAASIVRGEDFLKDDNRLTRICFAALVCLGVYTVATSFPLLLYPPIKVYDLYLATTVLTYAVMTCIPPMRKFFEEYFSKPELVADANESGRLSYQVLWNSSQPDNESSDATKIFNAFKNLYVVKDVGQLLDELGVSKIKAKALTLYDQRVLPVCEKILTLRSSAPVKLIRSIIDKMSVPLAAAGNWVERKSRPYTQVIEKTVTRVYVLVKPLFLSGAIGLAVLATAPVIASCFYGLAFGVFTVLTKDIFLEGDIATRVLIVAEAIFVGYSDPTILITAVVAYGVFSQIEPLKNYILDHFGEWKPCDEKGINDIGGVKFDHDVGLVVKTIKDTKLYNEFGAVFKESKAHIYDSIQPLRRRFLAWWNPQAATASQETGAS